MIKSLWQISLSQKVAHFGQTMVPTEIVTIQNEQELDREYVRLYNEFFLSLSLERWSRMK